jgi:hypothetical protein
MSKVRTPMSQYKTENFEKEAKKLATFTKEQLKN